MFFGSLDMGPWDGPGWPKSQKTPKLGFRGGPISAKNYFYELILYTLPNQTVNSMSVSFWPESFLFD